MNNNIKKESLDLEAMMNHLDQKAEKKKEFNSELESLNEMQRKSLIASWNLSTRCSTCWVSNC